MNRGSSSFFRHLRPLALTLLAGSGGCGSPAFDESVAARDHVVGAGASPLLDVNDVTVLFPYDSASEGLSPDLSLDSFMSRDIFAQVIAASKTVNITHLSPLGSDVYENWKIVSFRFDPCAPSAKMVSGDIPADLVGQVPGCIVQLRLIAQPVSERGPGAPTEPAGNRFSDREEVPAGFCRAPRLQSWRSSG
jgi:hypothetical protein